MELGGGGGAKYFFFRAEMSTKYLRLFQITSRTTLQNKDTKAIFRVFFLDFRVILAVKLKTGPRFGGFKVKHWSKLKAKNSSKLVRFLSLLFPNFYSIFGVCSKTQIVSLCAFFFAKLSGCQK